MRAGQEALVTRSENFHAIREFLEMRFGREAKLFHLCGKVPGLGLGGETGAHARFECFFLRTKRQSDDFAGFLRQVIRRVLVAGGEGHLDHRYVLTPLAAQLGRFAHGKGRSVAVRIIRFIGRGQRYGGAAHGEDVRQPPPNRIEVLRRIPLRDCKA